MDFPINTLIQGNCINVMESIPDKSINLLATDPPYQTKTKKVYGDNIEELDWNVWANQVNRILKDDGYLIMYMPIPNLPKFMNICLSIRPFLWQYIEYISNRMQAISSYFLAYNPILCFGNNQPLKRARDVFESPHRIGSKNYHICEKHLNTLEYMLDIFTKEGDVVLDPFMGSGTTAVACQRLNRKWIGIEINPEYYNIASQRIINAKQEGRLDAVLI